MVDTAAIKARFEALAPFLGERGRRLWAASEAYAAGRGGILAVSLVTGIARSTIGRGLAELGHGKDPAKSSGFARVPRPHPPPRRRAQAQDHHRTSEFRRSCAGLLEALADLVQSATRGDPEAALLWVSRSQRCLARALAERGFTAS